MRSRWPGLALVVSGLGAGGCGEDAGGDVDVGADVGVDVDVGVDADVGVGVDADVGVDVNVDADAGRDGDADDGVTLPVDPLFGYAGSIRMVEQYSDGAGEVVGNYVLVSMMSGPAVPRMTLVREEGACRLYKDASASCPGGCGTGVCATDGQCKPSPEPVASGDITITGLAATLVAKPTGSLYYTVTPTPPPGNLFAAGDTIGVSSAGAADFPAFDATVTGVADASVAGTGLVELVDGKPFDLTWSPRGDGATVEVTLQLGWHGLPPTDTIWCTAPDDAGQITVSAAIIEGFAYFDGAGLFQVPSLFERVRRTTVAGPHGPIEVVLASQKNLGVTHRTALNGP